MRPAPFAYARPADLTEAVELLAASGPGARVLAGGQSLLDMMNRRQVSPSLLVDIKRIPGLRYLSMAEGALRIGALSTHRDIEDATDGELLGSFDVLPRTAPLIGHLPIRTRGTLAGSLAHADPRAEWVVLAVLLDASITLLSTAGARQVPAAQFFTGMRQTAARPDELIVEVSLPHPAPGAALAEFSYRRGDQPTVLVGADLRLDGQGRIARARIVVGGVADHPVRAVVAEASLSGRLPDTDSIAEAGELVRTEVDPPSDAMAEAAYRAELSAVLTQRALTESARRLRGDSPDGLATKGGSR